MIIRSFFLANKPDVEKRIPKNAKFLDVGFLQEQAELLFLCNPDEEDETRRFIIADYTRLTIPESAIYLGKYLSKGKYHLVFEVMK